MAPTETRPEQARISVIIPTRNGAGPLAELLAALTIQDRRPDEIIVIDSGSTDATVEVANRYADIVEIIDPDRFDHGGTRSMAAQRATGDILVFFTQDVLPADRSLIDRLVGPILSSSDIALCYGRQLPGFEATAVAAHLRLFNYPPESEVRSFADRGTRGLAAVFASNSCAAYRAADLAAIGYFEDGLIFGEDTWAAAQLLEGGKKIAYAADARVYHSHNYTWGEEFRRYFDIGVLHRSRARLLRIYGGAGTRGMSYIRSGIGYLWKQGSPGMIPGFMVRVGGKYLAYRLGRMHRLLPPGVAAMLSMNKNWWQGERGR